MAYIHQGDVLFVPVKEEIKGQKQTHIGSFVLAEGEHTGHKHVISVPNLEDMDVYRTTEGGLMLVLRSEATVKHNQHGPLTVAPGTYRIGQEREYDPFAEITRKVID